MRNLGIRAGFNIFVTYFERYERPNRVEVDVFEDIYVMNEFISQPTKTIMSVYFAVCEPSGSIIRGLQVPNNVKYMDYYRYKELLHLEYCPYEQSEKIQTRARLDT
ncbi:MAG: hypothetical protein IJB32_01040 [Clostridia bacterium]|nr:hypothetical protein [Clostridia bacterium]